MAVGRITNLKIDAASRVLSRYLDYKKSRTALKPNRLVHRIADELTRFESFKDTPLTVTKDLRGKFVAVGGKRVGGTLNGEWVWFADSSRYTDDERLIAKAYAMA